MQQMDRDRDKNGGGNQRPSSLLDKQLEEILRTAERARRRQIFWQRVRSMPTRALRSLRGGRRLSAGRLMGLGFALCIVATLVRGMLPWLSALLILAGVILFVSPIFLSFRRGGGAGAHEERLWRGRVIEYPHRDPLQSASAWVRRTWRRLRGGPPPGRR